MTPTFPSLAASAELDVSALRRDPAARRIVRDWRRLSHGRTLIACSGGADSTALALTLAAAAAGLIVVGHVCHDLRERAEVEADRDFVLSLADRLGTPVMVREVYVPAGNAEAGARKVRLDALASMARQANCPFVATAHHALDQFETMVMALMRGAGLDGLAGIARERPLDDSTLRLIRPMLGVERTDAERLCLLAGVAPRLDKTNFDTSRLRAALRHGPLREMCRFSPQAPRRASDAAELFADAAGLVDEHVQRAFGDGFSWPRDRLRAERRLVIGQGLRRAHWRLTGGVGADRLTKRRVDSAVDAICDDSKHQRRFDWPMGVCVIVRAGIVVMERAEGGSDGA